jgi:SpoVK/Ycf46/Vps4 family AAA+-type ATPase
MATADQIKALIRSHAAGDDERFYGVAMQLAAGEAHVGHARVATELTKMIDEARAKPGGPAAALPRPRALVQPRGDLGELLLASYPSQRLHNLVVAESVRNRLDRVVMETRQCDELKHHGLAPIRKVLLYGLPGTGKTMTAAAMAGQLSLPLFSVRLDGLITRFLGETAAKLRLIFEAMVQTRGVYFFDEFDALGGDRQLGQDVGEIRRVLNSFLQFIEQDESNSLIIAATNHVQLLDKALFRRFDQVIEYSLPSALQAEAVLRSRLGDLDVSTIDWLQVAQAAEGLSHAELARAADYAAKDAVLAKRRIVDTVQLMAALEDRQSFLR